MKILFLYYDPHPAHEAMAKAVGADFFPAPKLKSGKKGIAYNIIGTTKIIKSAISIPRDYDVYLCEGTYIFPALAKKLGLIKNAKIINILASPLLYYIKTGVIKGPRKKFALRMLKLVDGFVCMGKMEEKLIKEIIPDANTMVAYPFIMPALYKRILKYQKLPNLNSHKILFIGKQDAYYKGLDILVLAFKEIKKKWPDAELRIAGKIKDAEKYINDLDGVRLLGFVKDIVHIMKDSAVYVHPGRGDAFPVSSLEAMLAGLPTIVSVDTGTSEVVQQITKRMVVGLDSTEVYNAIDWYFKLNNMKRMILSKRSIEISKNFEEKRIVRKFQLDFNKLKNWLKIDP